MNSKLWMQKVLAMCLMVAIYATYSMVAFAGNNRFVGELTVTGNAVTVNGEAAENGRSVFSSSNIVTPENGSAVINVAKLGAIELAPNSSLALSFDENGISGNLTAGKVTVLGASKNISFNTPNGNVNLKTGESASASKAQDDDTTKKGGKGWFIWAAVIGGAIAAILIAASTDNNRVSVGGTTTVVSPVR